jgi:ABC-type anion transport system duplicated permease subunit
VIDIDAEAKALALSSWKGHVAALLPGLVAGMASSSGGSWSAE